MEAVVAREEVRFRSGDDECAAWLFRPDGEEPGPCIVLAHGFGGTREARLDAYAERFCAAGYVALVFDYRHFGASSGEPRQLISIRGQRADWRAAVAYARELEDVDANRVVAWGTSFSGGYVIELAAADKRLVATIAQTPFTDGPVTLRGLGAANLARLAGAAIRDQLRALLGREPYPIPLVAPPGTVAAMNTPDALPGYTALYPPDQPMRNEFLPRSVVGLPFFSPLRQAAAVECPLLVQVCADDAVTPPPPARKVAERAPRGELREYPGGHFEIYLGDHFERSISDQLDFLERVL